MVCSPRLASHTGYLPFEPPALVLEMRQIVPLELSGRTTLLSVDIRGHARCNRMYFCNQKVNVCSRNKLAPHNILVQTVKPGRVRTAMTSHLKDSVLMASPKTVARDIVSAIRKKKEVLYTPFFWSLIMWIIKKIPEPVFKRMKL